MKSILHKVVLLIAPLLMAASWVGIAFSAGETYQWQFANNGDPSSNGIIGHGGVFTNNANFTGTDSPTDPILYTASLNNTCQIILRLPKSQIGQTDASAQVSSNPDGCAPVDPSAKIAASANAPISDNGQTCNGGWISCGIYQFAIKTVRDIEQNVIIPFLQIQPVSMDQNYTPYKIWGSFRILADVFFVLAFLFMAMSQATSIGLDNYSARRLLPRLVAAAILIQFSYVLVALAIDISNVVGGGIGAIATSPISGHTTITIDHLTGGLGLAAGLAGAVALGGGIVSGTILLTLLTALLGVLLAFLTLVFRQVLIVFLLVISPLAFALWVLPNTEEYFRLWHRNLTRLLIMYPLVVLLFASGEIFGAAVSAGNGGGIGNSSLRSLISVIANVLPLFLLPATFSFAGELMTRGHSAFRALHGMTRSATENSGAFQQFKTRTQQRKRDLAAGQGVNLTFGLGGRRFTGSFTSRVGALMGRGLFETVTTAAPAGRRASDVRAQAAYSKVRGEWKKRLDDEAFTFEGYQVLSRGIDWGQSEITKLEAKKLTATADERHSIEGTIIRYKEGITMASRYRNVNAAADAAALWLGNVGQAEEIDRQKIVARSKPTRTGKLIAGQVWGDTRNAGRSSNVHLAFKDIQGYYDDVNMVKYVKKKGQGDWAGFSEDAFKELARNGAIREMASSSGGRRTLAGILGSGGPQAGAAQQEIIIQALRGATAEGRAINVDRLIRSKGQDW